MHKVGIILTTDSRSQAYIQKICFNQIQIDEFIVMNSENKQQKYSVDEKKSSLLHGFDLDESVIDTLNKNNFSYKEFNFQDINHPLLIEHIQNSSMDFFIFTGGGILKHDILSLGKKFIHFHPGIVPYYRGSTCFYYSIIDKDECGVTAFLMDEKLDTGPILLQKYFPKPNHIYIDNVYDAHIRSETLVELFKKNLLLLKEVTIQNPNDGETFFVIHPVLKHISILSCI